MNTTDDFILTLPENEQAIMKTLVAIIRSCLPEYCFEKQSYGVPYFFGHSRICFAWPASVKGSGFKNGVRFGLCRGHALSNAGGLFKMENRKEVGWIDFTSVAGVEKNHRQIRETLNEAVIADEMMAPKKRKRSGN